MTTDEKDRFGDKLRDVEKAREDKYFADRDRELLQKRQTPPADDPGVGAPSSMRCPKDGTPLAPATRFDVTVEECPRCEGIWLDKGELDEIGRREHGGWLTRYLGRKR